MLNHCVFFKTNTRTCLKDDFKEGIIDGKNHYIQILEKKLELAIEQRNQFLFELGGNSELYELCENQIKNIDKHI